MNDVSIDLNSQEGKENNDTISSINNNNINNDANLMA